MSDAPITSEDDLPAPPMPDVLLGRSSAGYFVGLMHMPGKNLRPFVADFPDLIDRLESIAIAEFGIKPDDARQHALCTIADHVQLEKLPDQHADALEENELLRAELGQAKAQISGLCDRKSSDTVAKADTVG